MISWFRPGITGLHGHIHAKRIYRFGNGIKGIFLQPFVRCIRAFLFNGFFFSFFLSVFECRTTEHYTHSWVLRPHNGPRMHKNTLSELCVMHGWMSSRSCKQTANGIIYWIAAIAIVDINGAPRATMNGPVVRCIQWMETQWTNCLVTSVLSPALAFVASLFRSLAEGSIGAQLPNHINAMHIEISVCNACVWKLLNVPVVLSCSRRVCPHARNHGHEYLALPQATICTHNTQSHINDVQYTRIQWRMSDTMHSVREEGKRDRMYVLLLFSCYRTGTTLRSCCGADQSYENTIGLCI